jgi:hypothetical protein
MCSEVETTVSGNDAHEALVQFPLIVEDRLANLINRPHALRVIGVIIDEPAREYLVAVSRRIEEVDRLASSSTRTEIQRASSFGVPESQAADGKLHNRGRNIAENPPGHRGGSNRKAHFDHGRTVRPPRPNGSGVIQGK